MSSYASQIKTRKHKKHGTSICFSNSATLFLTSSSLPNEASRKDFSSKKFNKL